MTRVRTGTIRAALLATCLTAVAGGATAGAAARPVPSLTGTVTLTGSTTGYLAVRLAAPATLDNAAFGRGGVTITGAGRYVGFFLRQEKPGGVRLLGGRAEGSRLGTYLMPLQGLADGPSLRLPAGSYRLYLLADGKPATVTLRLRGLAGSSTLRPAKRVPYTLASPAATVATPGGNVAFAGADATLDGPGIAFDFLRTVNSNFQASNTQLCFYDGKPPPAPLAYAPGCPRSAFSPVFTVVAPGIGRTEGASYGGSGDLPAGTYAQGFNFHSIAVAEGYSYVAGFMAFD